MKTRYGFTLIELLMVTVIGAVVLTSAVRLIVGQQRSQTVLVGRENVQESLRTGMSVLIAELREISPAEDDIVAMESDSIVIRATRSLGLVCDLMRGPAPTFTVQNLGPDVQAADSFTVLAANRPGQHDDEWLFGKPQSVAPSGTCPDGTAAQVLHVAPMAAELVADSVRTGAPLRRFDRVMYGLIQDGGTWYLGTRVNGGTADPLVGPLLPPAQGGLELEYLDQYGNVTSNEDEVARIRVMLRAESKVRTAGGAIVGDSLSGLVGVRN